MPLVRVALYEMPTGIIGFIDLERIPVPGEVVYFNRPGSPNEEVVHRLVLGVVHGPTAGRRKEPAATLHIRTLIADKPFPWYTDEEVRR